MGHSTRPRLSVCLLAHRASALRGHPVIPHRDRSPRGIPLSRREPPTRGVPLTRCLSPSLSAGRWLATERTLKGLVGIFAALLGNITFDERRGGEPDSGIGSESFVANTLAPKLARRPHAPRLHRAAD